MEKLFVEGMRVTGSSGVITVTTDASGAYHAACSGQVVVIVDVIDMSTTLEVAIQEGAALVLGASLLIARHRCR
ncbi:hypothetical protein SSCH_50031 [Syntrophaceticus schinkii]|uniref:Uncharacterized protein n=1 Tax=Syntrophaceticus schinkii TaxID=499207 RepID=A0A0B7MFV2_9FIRM|nr:hypothetical protein SSCH_50031 [Syntrophaceticus schinkii]